jgi:antitoxin (DNA-binding transcriptional repressor) of toxin-antitoxin stability system
MEHISVRNFRANLTDYADRAAAGEEFVIRRRGSPVALLRAAKPAEQVEEITVHRLRTSIGRTLRGTQRGQRWLITYYGIPSQLVLMPVPEGLLPTLRSDLEMDES